MVFTSLWLIMLKILIGILIGILFIFLLIGILKIINFNSLKFKSNAQQRGELINNNKFVTKDMEYLNVKCRLSKTSEHIIIFVPDLYDSHEDFRDFEKFLNENTIKDYFSYSHRTFKNQTKRCMGAYISDLLEIIDYLKERNLYKSITVITLGYSAALFLMQAKNKNITNLILINCANKSIPYKNKYNLKLFLGTFFKSNALIPYNIDINDISHDLEFNKKIISNIYEKGFFSIKEYYQMNYAISNFIPAFKKIKNKVFFLNTPSNSLVHSKKFTKKLNRINSEFYEICIFKNSLNYLLNDSDKKIVFDKIISIIEAVGEK